MLMFRYVLSIISLIEWKILHKKGKYAKKPNLLGEFHSFTNKQLLNRKAIEWK